MNGAIHIRATGIVVGLILYSALSLHLHCQEQKSSSLPDTSSIMTSALERRSLLSAPALRNLFEIDSDGNGGFQALPFAVTGSGHLPLSLRLSLAPPMSMLAGKSYPYLSLASCWRDELAKQQEFTMFRKIIGAIEAGGTAYLVYKHFKHYGLK